MGEDPRGPLEARSQLAAVQRALAQLPEEQREVVVLITIEGLGYADAAAILDLPIGTVSSRLLCGRTALLQLLRENDNG